jgi:hypothetical protein
MNIAHAKEVIDKLQILLPEVLAWIDGYIEANAHRAVPVADLHFPRLVKYFSPERLANSKVVHADHIQMPPLTQMRFPYFSDFENMKFIGITYKDTFFLAPGAYESESTHFHELVHIIQWDILGPEKFLAVYAIYLLAFNYDDSPLERMAYELQAMFDQGRSIPELENRIREKTLSMVEELG